MKLNITEALAQECKVKIKAIMNDLGIEQSDTLNRLEQDCIARICTDYVSVVAEEKNAIIQSIQDYDALPTNKATIIHKLGIWELSSEYGVTYSQEEIDTILLREYDFDAPFDEDIALASKSKMLIIMHHLSVTESCVLNKLEQLCISQFCPPCDHEDEQTCRSIIEKILAYDTQEENKKPFLEKLLRRIDEIWTAEDFVVFEKLFSETNPHDAQMIEKNKEIVNTTGRTDGKVLFLDAFSALNADNIQVAAKYSIAKEKGTFASLMNMGKESIYKKITCGGIVIHPALTNAINSIKQEKENAKGKSIFSGFGKKQKHNAQTLQTFKFCTQCGSKLDVSVKFCSNCGVAQD